MPSLHYGIFFTLLDSLSCRHGKLSSIVWTPVYPFKPQYTHTNSPNWSPYISFMNELREFDKRLRHFPLGDHFFNSHNLLSWHCMVIIRRKLTLVTTGTWRVKLHQRLAQKPTRYALAGHSLTLLQKPCLTTEAIEAAIHHGNSILLYRHNFLIILYVIQ